MKATRIDQNRKKRKKSRFFFLLNVITEGLATGLVLYCTFTASCVLGNEVSGPVYIFLLFIFPAFIPDLYYYLLTPKLHTLGIDPLGVMFNFIIGVLCILIGVSLIMVIISFCGFYAQFLLVIAGALSVCSGVFHLMNACMCHKAIPKSERYYKPRRSKPKKAPKDKKKEAKPAKKGKAEKKPDKKVENKPDKKAEKKPEKKSDKKTDKKPDKKSEKKPEKKAEKPEKKTKPKSAEKCSEK
ncbi:PREDICTED: uncharacterized protein LOC108971016 [Bactrocera latifrons]|uniref:uncharacterized protein LOC108971016 n=1 Tax=Bactrocera latifrons TaxID=174628 RepID=UPI0008DE3EA9|nr:PREDICTED: uncharacterized protein LOC108971016 [Bactrocera latifrons]